MGRGQSKKDPIAYALRGWKPPQPPATSSLSETMIASIIWGQEKRLVEEHPQFVETLLDMLLDRSTSSEGGARLTRLLNSHINNHEPWPEYFPIARTLLERYISQLVKTHVLETFDAFAMDLGLRLRRGTRLQQILRLLPNALFILHAEERVTEHNLDHHTLLTQVHKRSTPPLAKILSDTASRHSQECLLSLGLWSEQPIHQPAWYTAVVCWLRGWETGGLRVAHEQMQKSLYGKTTLVR